MSHSIIPVFRTPASVEHNHTPVPSENLFSRIIRNPTNHKRPMRERRCAELLCAVLLTCRQLRTIIFEKFAEICGWSDLPLAELEYEIETEQAIGSKRDDLRIEGFDPSNDERQPVVLWTVEIKVQAGIHYSSAQNFGDYYKEDHTEEPSAELDKHSVAQLKNYDAWLEHRDVEGDRKAGLVLALPSLAEKVADLQLKQPWHCLRWSDLGDWIESALDEDAIPESESLIASHLLGFILQHLRDPNEMVKRIDIDDLALIRAFGVKGKECERRIDNVVAPLVETFDKSGVRFRATKHQRTLYGTHRRSMILGDLIRNDSFSPQPNLRLFAGVCKSDCCIWIEAQPGSPIFEKIKSHCERLQSALTEPGWEIPTPEQSSWVVLRLSKPLAWLLLEDDQATALAEFVRAAIEDLKRAGIIEALQSLEAK